MFASLRSLVDDYNSVGTLGRLSPVPSPVVEHDLSECMLLLFSYQFPRLFTRPKDLTVREADFCTRKSEVLTPHTE